MRRAIPVFAALLAGLGLALLLLLNYCARREQPQPGRDQHSGVAGFDPEPAPFQVDPSVALAEIHALRKARGTVLTGTTLALAEQPDEFQRAVAECSGAEPSAIPASPSADEEFTLFLRRTSRELGQYADRYENQNRYDDADAARRLATKVRAMARKLSVPRETPEPITHGELNPSPAY